MAKIVYDTGDPYRPNRKRLFAVGGLYLSPTMKGTWVRDEAQWYVSALSPTEAVDQVLQEHGSDISKTWINCTGTNSPDGMARILYVANVRDIEDLPSNFPVTGRQEYLRATVVRGTTLTFRYLSL